MTASEEQGDFALDNESGTAIDGPGSAVDATDSFQKTSGDPAEALTEDLALAQLESRDSSAAQIEEISRSSTLMKSRKVRFAVAVHTRTPRRIALRLIRELYTFDLMQVSLRPVVAADLKRVADELLVGRLASITPGERISLARKSSSIVATALLLDKESRVWQAALENPRLVEASVVKAIAHKGATAAFVSGVCHHAKWSVRPEIRVALLRNEHTPLARAVEFARRLSPVQLRDILRASRLPEKTKEYLRKDAEKRKSRG